MGRNKERVKRIDEFLRENYPTGGALFCAEYLDEPVKYIRGRVGVLKLSMIPGYKRKTDNNQVVDVKKVTVKTVSELEDEIKDLREINKELRRENIILVHDNMNLRKNL